jgi:RNA polymerase sigma-70 factor (ECF subfamily)
MHSLDQAATAVMDGDVSAFRRIVEGTSPRLLRLAARLLGSPADAEDVVQEAYVKAYRALKAGRFDQKSRVDTWLYRIVVNAALDSLRRRSRGRTVSDALGDVALAGAPSAEARVALAELDDWLAALPAEQRTAITLKALEGLTSPEIAGLMGSTEGAVEQLLVRARATLRQRRGE